MSELEQMADRAYRAMLHDIRRLPADIALDMCQDVCGERPAALAAVLRAIEGQLQRDRPEERLSGSYSSLRAQRVCDLLCEQRYDAAANTLEETRRINRDIRQWIAEGRLRYTDNAERDARAAAWLRWCCYAERAVEIARRLTEAAAGSKAGAA